MRLGYYALMNLIVASYSGSHFLYNVFITIEQPKLIRNIRV